MSGRILRQFEQTDTGVLVRAPAKLNLALLVNGKRADGYHEIRSIMAKVSFYDELLIERRAEPGLEVVCRGQYWAPQGKANLVWQACELLARQAGMKPRWRVRLLKQIPAGSGLGSASSDAAAALLGVDRLEELNSSGGQLREIASQLGSDVPFFLDGPLAVCSGRGEKIQKIPENFDFAAILVLPDINVSTARIYESYRHDSQEYEALWRALEGHLGKNRIDLAAGMCANMLSDTCLRIYEQLGATKKKLEGLGIGPVCLTGSGGGMFALLSENQQKNAGRYQRMILDTTGCKSILVYNNRW